jgi:hypothetical protein
MRGVKRRRVRLRAGAVVLGGFGGAVEAVGRSVFEGRVVMGVMFANPGMIR